MKKFLYKLLCYVWQLLIGGDIIIIINSIANWGIPQVFCGIWALVTFTLGLFLIGFEDKFNN